MSEGDVWATRLPARLASVAVARHFADEAGRAMGCNDGTEHVQLLVSELVSNVVRHAGTPVEVTLYRNDGRLRVEVHDDDPTPPRIAASRPDAFDVGGRGMFLVDALASAWGIEHQPNGKTIWFEVA